MTWLASAVAALAMPAVTSASLATVSKAPHVSAPRSGKFTGQAGRGRTLTLWIAGKSVQLVSFQFGCPGILGTTNLDEIALTKTGVGYRFAIKSYGSVTYADGRRPENVAISIAGQFDRPGTSARGTLSVTSHRCGKLRGIRWSARR